MQLLVTFLNVYELFISNFSRLDKEEKLLKQSLECWDDLAIWEQSCNKIEKTTIVS